MRQGTFRQHDCAVNDRGLAQSEGALRARFSGSTGKAGLATVVGLMCSLWTTGVAEAQAQKQTPESLLRYTPVQKSVEYDTPEAADVPKCTVALEQGSYVVTNPANQVLRSLLMPTATVFLTCTATIILAWKFIVRLTRTATLKPRRELAWISTAG
ncbi:MAG: hypothetical protein U0936_14665 [Planctomycetaceae bacterium]